ncbi:hypothetical protein DL98DRAFT_141463 [Cadophora sp. DSE1049]|nr:hypothetical protein DL98DRAFT_141463 [Cadophora sp. DSE1049]
MRFVLETVDQDRGRGRVITSRHGSSRSQTLVSSCKVLTETPTALIPCIYEKPNSARFASIKILSGKLFRTEAVGMTVDLQLGDKREGVGLSAGRGRSLQRGWCCVDEERGGPKLCSVGMSRKDRAPRHNSLAAIPRSGQSIQTMEQREISRPLVKILDCPLFGWDAKPAK